MPLRDSADVVFEDELALIDAFEKLAAQAVDGLALLVHHVVVLEQVFARFEVLRFDGFLRGLDAIGDHLRLDGNAFFHAQLFKQGADPLLGEDAHEVVFEREDRSAMRRDRPGGRRGREAGCRCGVTRGARCRG